MPDKRLAWAVFGCLAVHNLEEGLAMPVYLPRVQHLMGAHVPAGLPGPEAFYGALAGATVLPLLLVAYATHGRPSRHKCHLVLLLAGVLLLNVALPHVPAAVLLGGYAPGAVTAVLLNLPLGLYVFARARRAGWITRRELAALLGAALLLLLAAVPLLLLGARALTGP